MQLKQFWNKAIEFYCTIQKTQNNVEFDTVFIAISEGKLEKVQNHYLKKIGLEDAQIEQFAKRNIDNAGGCVKSYYSVIRELHKNQNNPKEFSFVRFSILVIGAYQQDDSPLKYYWKYFDPFLEKKNIKTIQLRTAYVEGLINNLNKYCFNKHDKTFFSLNVFGSKSAIVNVGRIKAHSVFQGSSLKKIKKSIYDLRFDESHAIEDLSIDNVGTIIENAKLERIFKLYDKDGNTKEIIYQCLLIWLKNWNPEQEEKTKLLEGKKPTKQSKINIYRLWSVEDKNITIKHCFIYKSQLAEEGKFYLNKEKNIFVDTVWSKSIGEKRILHQIENFSRKENLDDNDLGLIFQFKNNGFQNEHALEFIPKTNPRKFIEYNRNKWHIKNNPIVIFSKHRREENELDYIAECTIPEEGNLTYYLHKVKSDFKTTHNSFIIIDNIDITLIGTGDGRSGKRSFLSDFEIRVHYGTLVNGTIEIVQNEEIKEINIEDIQTDNNLLNEHSLGELKPGKYSIQYRDVNKNIATLSNGNKYIEFEMLPWGNRDERDDQNLQLPNYDSFQFEEKKDFDDLEDKIVIFRDSFNNNEDEFQIQDQHLDFYLKKEDEFWSIAPNRDITFLQCTCNNYSKINYYRFYSKPMEQTYLSTDYIPYKYTFKYCERPVDVRIPFNVNQFYQKNEPHKLVNNYIDLCCYYFELVSFDDELKIKYPNIQEGDKLYVYSNIQTGRKRSEQLLDLINQEFFPFKK